MPSEHFMASNQVRLNAILVACMPSCNDRLGTILNKFPLFRGNLSINCSIIDLPPLARVFALASCGSQCVPYSYGRSLIWLA